MDADTQLSRVVRLMVSARKILIFTGAGLSTTSGIPDFRGPKGVWKSSQPVYFDEFLSSEEKRLVYWDDKVAFYRQVQDARPNAAHEAIAALDQRTLAVVTQNIDGLQQLAGSSPEKLIEVHGTTAWVECLRCHARVAPGESIEFVIRERRAPTCACGGWLKPATISFGQPLDESALGRAAAAARDCDLVLALGSTLSVYPAASFPLSAARRGVPYIIINQGPTEHDEIATVRIEGDVVSVLPRLVSALG